MPAPFFSKARTVVRIGVLAVAIVFAACAPPPTRSTLGQKPTSAPRTPTPQPASDEEAIRQLILLEGRGVVEQDIQGLMDLWAPDGMVVDAKHTPDDPGDDARWRGRDAIRERYVVLVFPGNPGIAAPADIQITITGDTASATSTTVIGSEVAVGGDRWEFVKRDGRWWIKSLTYNLETR